MVSENGSPKGGSLRDKVRTLKKDVTHDIGRLLQNDVEFERALVTVAKKVQSLENVLTQRIELLEKQVEALQDAQP